jgi:hypothetical protein
MFFCSYVVVPFFLVFFIEHDTFVTSSDLQVSSFFFKLNQAM